MATMQVSDTPLPQWQICKEHTPVKIRQTRPESRQFLLSERVSTFDYGSRPHSTSYEARFILSVLEIQYRLCFSKELVLQFTPPESPQPIYLLYNTSIPQKDTLRDIYAILKFDNDWQLHSAFTENEAIGVFRQLQLPLPPEFPKAPHFDIPVIRPSRIPSMSEINHSDITQQFDHLIKAQTHTRSNQQSSLLKMNLEQLQARKSKEEQHHMILQAVAMSLRRVQKNPSEIVPHLSVTDFKQKHRPDGTVVPVNPNQPTTRTNINFQIPVCMFSRNIYLPDFTLTLNISRSSDPQQDQRKKLTIGSMMSLEQSFFGVFILTKVDSFWLCNAFYNHVINNSPRKAQPDPYSQSRRTAQPVSKSPLSQKQIVPEPEEKS
ncbi:hypothetical protein BLNAU_15765 [Blattamonas nauphoetae]|uniref:Uncharacterized protein n=1 Tax=Blattamonas nauphoetae TaxID=2049346 RepID=A0ABQ9XEL9_9EUKA|nr:hypothetical protein BLNAU_15765 [Blattamonas nauphoetae]